MRKSLSLLLLLLVALAAFILQDCSRLEHSTLKNEQQTGLPWHYVSIDKAERELESFLAEIYPTLKASPKRVISERFTLRNAATKADGDPIIMHIFTFEGNQGFAIMAGDKRVPSPMCFVETGHYVEDDPDTDLDEFIMSELTGMYQAARVLPDSIKYEVSPLPNDFPLLTKADGFVPVDTIFNDNKYYVYYNWAQNGNPNGTILSTKWKQSTPFNDYCPIVWDSTNTYFRRAYTGCTITAVGQIMAFWKMNPPYGNPNYGLNWNYIEPIVDASSVPTNHTGWTMLKNLLLHLGDPENLDASYKYDGTGASQYKAARTFVNFGYVRGGSIQNYQLDSVRYALNTGPVLGVGYAKRYYKLDGSYDLDEGHTWVYDQCYSRKRPVMVYDSNWHIITGQWQIDRVLHINWGWGGVFNGYYSNSRFDARDSTSNPLLCTKSYIDTTGVDYFYQYSLQINTGIRPTI
ncbi:MAG: C10 family peptidase [Bacteroidales bacterium]|nr:C10 family peptidase [Bacteroidales bacterium]